MTPFSCCVCIDPEATENPFFTCKSCGACIHALCYGIDIEVDSSDNWLCSPCKMGISQPTCAMCLQTTGAIKKTSCGKWAHVICALFTEGVIIEDKNEMEPINLSEVSISKQNKTCAYCLKAVGICCLCSKSKCPKRIHISCAQRSNCTIEVISEQKSIDFRAYCIDHKPSKSKRRVSARFVREIMAKKGKKCTKGHEKKHPENSDWILKASADKSASKKPKNQSSVQFSSVHLEKEKTAPKQLNSHEKEPANAAEPSTSSAATKKRKHQSKAKATHFGKENMVPKQPHVLETDQVDTIEQSAPNVTTENSTHESNQDRREDENCESPSKSLWWDSCGGTLDMSLGFVEIKHRCYKDEKTKKLKEKNRSLKDELDQLKKLNVDMQRKLLQPNTKSEVSNSSSSIIKRDKGMESLLTNITPKICDDDKSKMIYPNGVKVATKHLKHLDNISSAPMFDRSFINSSFLIFFSDRYILKQKKKGIARKDILIKFRESNRYNIMRNIYEYRVLCDSNGDVKVRFGLFKNSFRVKFNNWWNVHFSNNNE